MQILRKVRQEERIGPAGSPPVAPSADPLFWRNVRMIARVRVLLALVTAVVLLLDPRLPPSGHWARSAATYANVLLIILYSLWVWRRHTSRPLRSSLPAPVYLPALTIWLDVLFGAALIGNTGAHQSPFYLWIVFTIVGAALKGGWWTVARVCLAELILYLYVALWLPPLDRSEFVLLGFLARTLLLFAVALVLAHMGQRLLEQNRMLASLHQAAAQMSAGRTTADILGRAADSLTDLLEAERVAADVGEEGPEGVRPVLINMNREQGERLLHLARAQVAAAVPASGPYTLLSEAPHDTLDFAAAGTASWRAQGLASVRSLLVTRLTTNHGLPGVLVACNRRGRRAFTAADQEAAELLAALAGPLLQTARRQEQRRFEAGGVERRRIAAELHDGLIQTLSSIDLRILTCRDLWHDQRWETLGTELRTLKALVEEALVEARGAINELAPARLRQEGLIVYLESCIRQFEQRAGIPVAASIDLGETGPSAEAVPEPAALLLMGLLREGLNNVRKHAQARHVSLRIRRHGEEIKFHLADDGAGFRTDERPPAPARHYGLAYLGERITTAGGELCVTSRPGEGTVLEARLPLLTEERLVWLFSGEGE